MSRGPPPLLRWAPLVAVLTLGAAQEPPISVSATTIHNDYPENVRFEARVTGRVAVIESVDLLLGLRGDTSITVVPAEFAATREPTVSVDWDPRRAGIPPGAVVRYAWRVRDAADNRHETRFETWIVEDARFEWETIENDRLALWWYAGDRAFAQRVFDTGEEALDRMLAGGQPRNIDRLHLVLYADQAAFAGWHDYVQDWVGGEAYPWLAVTIQVIPPQATRSWIDEVIPHEIAHLFFHQATHTPLALGPPSWLNEGYAGYHEFGGHEGQLRQVRQAAASGDLIPLRLASGSFGHDDGRVGLLYAESLSAVTFLYEVYGEAGVADLLAAYRSGADTDEALLAVTGLDFEGFQLAWWEWLGGEPGGYPTPPAPGSFAAATSPAPTIVPTTNPSPPAAEPAVRLLCCPLWGALVPATVIASRRAGWRRRLDRPPPTS